MAILLIDIMVTNERVKYEVISDHYWYDHSEKRLIKLSGGSLAFRYTGNEMVVTTEPLFAMKNKSSTNKSCIMDWINENTHTFSLSIQDGGTSHVALTFDESKLSEMEDSLYKNRFEYEIMGSIKGNHA